MSPREFSSQSSRASAECGVPPGVSCECVICGRPGDALPADLVMPANWFVLMVERPPKQPGASVCPDCAAELPPEHTRPYR